MIEDKLSTDQRIRLEALSQATTSSMGVNASAEHLIDKAMRFEAYIRDGENKYGRPS